MKATTSHVITKSLFAAAFLLLGFAVAQLVPVKTAGNPPSCVAQTVITDEKAKTVSVMIDEGDGTIKIVRDLAWHDNDTAYDALKQASEKAGAALGVKDYGGELGVFIESIDGKKGSKDAWWQYWVNNVYGEKGASTALIKPGDVMEWKLTKGQFAP